MITLSDLPQKQSSKAIYLLGDRRGMDSYKLPGLQTKSLLSSSLWFKGISFVRWPAFSKWSPRCGKSSALSARSRHSLQQEEYLLNPHLHSLVQVLTPQGTWGVLELGWPIYCPLDSTTAPWQAWPSWQSHLMVANLSPRRYKEVWGANICFFSACLLWSLAFVAVTYVEPS